MQEEKRYSFYGFHGTAESCAKSINESRNFEYGELRNDHWLGQGAYFYKDDEEQAIIWAKNKVTRHQKFRGENPCVIEVILEADESNFLNLDARKGLNFLQGFIDSLKTKGIKIEVSSDKGSPASVRCFILSLLPSDIWMIQRTFQNIPSRFDKEKLFMAMELNLAGTQICVRNNEVVKGNSMRVRKIINPIIKKASGKPRLFEK